MSGDELATGGWAHLKQADCRRTAKLIIEIALEFELGWRAGKVFLEVVRRFRPKGIAEDGDR